MLKHSLRLLLTAALFVTINGCGEEEEPSAEEKFGEDTQSVRLMLFRDGTVTRALSEYRMSAGSFPTTEQGLNALVKRPKGVAPDAWRGPYLDGPEAWTDMWGNELHYRSPSKVEPDKSNVFDLWSVGPDGTDDTDDDITNHQYK